MRKISLFTLLSIALMVCISCSQKTEYTGPQYGEAPGDNYLPVYYFAIHPLHNPSKLFQVYQPLMVYLNRELKNVHFSLEASRDYAAFEEKYQNRKPDFILPNPWQTIQAIEVGYHVIASAGDAADFRGIFIVRKDNPITQPSELRGHAVSYPSPTALAACIMPQYFLYQNGVNVNHDIENRYVGSQESSIMNAYLGQTAAGATWPPPWRAFQLDHPDEAADLKVIWETEPLINNSVMARDDVPVGVWEQVQTLLTTLHKTAEGQAILTGMETARFIPANDRTYDVVLSYVSRFETEVRKVEEK